MSEVNTESHSFDKNPSAVILKPKDRNNVEHFYFLVRLIYKGASHNVYLGNIAS